MTNGKGATPPETAPNHQNPNTDKDAGKRNFTNADGAGEGGQGYAGAYPIYDERGWPNSLKVRRGVKKPPPAGFTGYKGQTPSAEQKVKWAEEDPDGNLILRLQEGYVGLDVDNYDAKRGGLTLAEAEKRWGKLPPTYTSTSRDDGISGIRVYKIPKGVKLASLVEFPELELGDIEIIQHHHRYVTSWPSMHPDGRQYGWRDPAWSVMDGPPRADDIPELSQTWVEGLAVRPKARGKNKDKPRIVEDTEFVECPYVIERSLTAGAMSAKVAKRLGEATAHCYSDSRHDHILGDTLALLRYGKRGECGVFEAISALMKTFAKAVAKDRPGGEQEAEDEFMRMLSNEGAARLLSDGDDPDDQVPNDDDAVEPLHGLPHEDYGREFDAPPPSAPLAVARQIDRLFRIDGARTLLSWRGGWMGWHTTHWSELDASRLRSHVYRSMSNATYEHVTANGVETRSWNPDKRKVANVMEAMAALAPFPSDIDPPWWVADSAGETEASQMISCANGLFDLPRRRLVEHTPALFNLVSVPFDYDPEAGEPTVWLEFLASLWPDDPDSVMLLQEYFGYVLSGRTDMHKMLALIGPIRGGKGTIARTLTKLVGKGNVAGPTLANLGTNFGLSPLLGKPLAIISDARLGSAPSHTVVERLLSITGEDMLTIDRKYREPWTGRLPTRFVMLSNELPRFTDSSGAIATRMLILQLTKSFLNREDRTIEGRLAPDMPGILNWALDGLDRLATTGRFTVPESSEAAATMMMDLASPVSAFVRERCELGPDKAVARDLLYVTWKLWAESNGHHAGAKITFGRSLHAAVPGLGRADISVGDKRVHGYRGIGLFDGPDYRNNNAYHPAQPAQDGEPPGQNGSGDQNHSARSATASRAPGEAQEAEQVGAQDEVNQNRCSGPTALVAQDETQCRSNNGLRGPWTIVPPKQEQAGQDKAGKSVSRDFAALRRQYGIEPADPPANTATATAASDKPPAPVRINGRPIDRSAHYKAPGKGRKDGKGRRKR